MASATGTNALLILIPVTLALVTAAVGTFFWAVNHARFEDLDTPKILPLMDAPPAAHHRHGGGDATANGPDLPPRDDGTR